MNTIRLESIRYMQPWAHQRPKRKRYLDRFRIFLQDSLGDRPTDEKTDHATRSVTIGGIYLRSKGKERK